MTEECMHLRVGLQLQKTMEEALQLWVVLQLLLLLMLLRLLEMILQPLLLFVPIAVLHMPTAAVCDTQACAQTRAAAAAARNARPENESYACVPADEIADRCPILVWNF